MKKHIIFAVAMTTFGSLFSFTVALAHTDAPATEITHMQEMALSDALYAKVQSGERTCASLNDGDFELLGEHFMEAILGDMHESTNEKFTDTLSHEGEEELHAVIGKYGTHCDAVSLGLSAEDKDVALSDARDGTVQALLWIFALYGVFSLVKRFIPKKAA